VKNLFAGQKNERKEVGEGSKGSLEHRALPWSYII